MEMHPNEASSHARIPRHSLVHNFPHNCLSRRASILVEADFKGCWRDWYSEKKHDAKEQGWHFHSTTPRTQHCLWVRENKWSGCELGKLVVIKRKDGDGDNGLYGQGTYRWRKCEDGVMLSFTCKTQKPCCSSKLICSLKLSYFEYFHGLLQWTPSYSFCQYVCII